MLSMIVFAIDFNSVTVVSRKTIDLPELGSWTGILFVGNPLLYKSWEVIFACPQFRFVMRQGSR